MMKRNMHTVTSTAADEGTETPALTLESLRQSVALMGQIRVSPNDIFPLMAPSWAIEFHRRKLERQRIVEEYLTLAATNRQCDVSSVRSSFDTWIVTVPLSSVDGAQHIYGLAVEGRPFPWERVA